MPTLSHRCRNTDNLKPTSCQPKPNHIRWHNVLKLGTNQMTTLAHRCKIITYQKPTKIPTLNQAHLLLALQSHIWKYSKWISIVETEGLKSMNDVHVLSICSEKGICCLLDISPMGVFLYTLLLNNIHLFRSKLLEKKNICWSTECYDWFPANHYRYSFITTSRL